MFILKNLNIEAKLSKLMLNYESSEAKRTCWIVKKFISKRSEHVYIEEFKYRSEAHMFVSSKIYFVAKQTCLYFKNLNIEAKKININLRI